MPFIKQPLPPERTTTGASFDAVYEYVATLAAYRDQTPHYVPRPLKELEYIDSLEEKYEQLNPRMTLADHILRDDDLCCALWMSDKITTILQ